jgi:hypothetical protein
VQTLINGVLKRVESTESLSEKRKRETIKRSYETIYSEESEETEESESLVIPPDEVTEDIGDSEERSEEKYFGKDVVVSPLAYFTLDDSLKHALNDYKAQISRTVKLVMAKRAKYGQKAATVQNKNDVLGEYPEKNTSEELAPSGPDKGPGLRVKRHYFTRPIDNIMYRITIDEHPMGIGQSRRNTYMLVDIAVIFYRKNGIGLGKEIILRSRILRFRKRAPATSNT